MSRLRCGVTSDDGRCDMTNLLRFITAAGLALVMGNTWSATPAGAGSVQFAAGDVQIIGPDNVSRRAAKGDVINERDTIATGADGTAHLRMADDGVIALRPNSRITIDTFRWQGKEDGSERSVIGLVRGGFRAITGVIGRRDKSTYVVNTPTATIGIRGTDHEPLYIPAPGAGETAAGPPGTYNKVNVGETFIRTAAGILELGANEVGFASLQPNIAPVKLDRVPDFMRRSPPPLGKPDRRNLREATAGDARHTREVAVRTARQEGRQAAAPRLPAIRTVTAEGDFDVRAQSGGFFRAPFLSGLAGGTSFPLEGDVVAGIGTVIIDGRRSNSILENAASNPTLLSDASSFRYARQAAPIIDSGSAIVDSVPVNWGIYAGGLQFDSKKGVIPAFFFHFMQTPSVTPPSVLQIPGSATYSSIVGFTAPIDYEKRVGGAVTAFQARVTFGPNPTLDSYGIRVTDAGGRNWTGSLSARSESLGDFARGVDLRTTCAGACGNSGSGDAAGFVIGPNGGGLISAYVLRAPGGSVAGSLLAKP